MGSENFMKVKGYGEHRRIVEVRELMRAGEEYMLEVRGVGEAAGF